MRRELTLREIAFRMFVWCVLLCAVERLAAAGTIYYISSTSGDDRNAGTSPSQAWQHLNEIYMKSLSSTPFLPGDSILLKRGDRWHEEIRLRAKGTRDNPISIGAYGEGQKPLLTGENEQMRWEPVAERLGIYAADLEDGSIPGAIVLDGKMLKTIRPAGVLRGKEEINLFLDKLNPEELAGEFENHVWIRMAEGEPLAVMPRIFRLAGVLLADSSYLRIENLGLERFYTGIDVEHSKDVMIQHNDVQDVLGIGIYLRADDVDCRVESNTVYRSGNTALYSRKGLRNTFRDNWVSHVNSTIAGVKVSGDAMGVGLEESQQSLVEHNYLAYSGGVDFYNERDSTVRYNYLYRVRSAGAPHGMNLNVYGNIYNLGAPEGEQGSRGVNAVTTGRGTIFVFNNTIFNGAAFLMMGSTAKGGKIVFADNIAATSRPDTAMAVFDSGVVSSHNCLFVPGETALQPVKTRFSPLANQRVNILDRDSVVAAPQFLSRSPVTPLDFQISAKSGCNSPVSNIEIPVPAIERTYDHDRHQTSGAVTGAFRVDSGETSAENSRRSCTAHCMGRQFQVLNRVYLIALNVAAVDTEGQRTFRFFVNGRRVEVEFDSPETASSQLCRYFLVRPTDGYVVVEADTPSDAAVVGGIDIVPFDVAHGDETQVIPW